VPISSSSQPSLMAQMLQDLELQPGQRVLEVGTGTGYNAALLAHLVGPGLVTSIDVDRDVLSRAWDHLRAFAERDIRLFHADGRAGLADAAPFDRIMVTAAAFDLEAAWLDQLAEGGRLLAPLVLGPGLEFIASGTVSHGIFEGRLTRAAYFMPLRTEGESGSGLPNLPPAATEPEVLSSPWAGWFERRRWRNTWLGFSQALAFLGLMQGLNVHHRALETGQSFGISDSGGKWCWFGQDEWQVSDTAGRELGSTLWQTFLDLGGPWPTEYRLRACPAGGLEAGGGFLRQGPNCQQRWQLLELRERSGWL
jgi:protein-L-isoaspartate(D-aspartate) O-methyltransferase